MRLPPQIGAFGLSSGCQTPPAFLGTDISVHAGQREARLGEGGKDVSWIPGR